MKLSCCMIVRDEAETLDRVLTCVKKFADEIIIVDTGSVDNSKEVAKKYTDKVYDFEWVDDFSKARNYAFEQATNQYVMWLDADDYIDDDNINKINEFLQKDEEFDVAYMTYASAFDENNKPTFCFKRERIVKNLPQFRFVDPIHEVIIPSGKLVYLDVIIEHRKVKPSNPMRNLDIYTKLKEKGIYFSPRMQFYYANELYYTKNYFRAIIEYESYLNLEAFIENKIQACLNCAQCYYALNMKDKAYKMLYSSFLYDKPRSEILCQIALYLCNECKWEQAIYWLKLAIGKPNVQSGGFILIDCYGYIPYYNLAYCEYRLKNYKKAVYYIQKALTFKPNDVSATKNLKFYSSFIKKNK